MLRESGILIISIVNILMITEVFPDILNIEMTVSVETYSKFIAELRAASNAQKKNRPPKIMP